MRFRSFTLAAAFLLASSSVEAQPSERVSPSIGSAPAGQLTAAAIAEAQTRFRRALELHDEGNLDASRMELRRAYDVAPNYKVLFNLAQVEFELHDYAAAMATFERYLNDGGDRIPKERRTQVERDVEKLRGRVGSLEIAVNVPGAQISVDDVAVGTSPLIHPVTLNAGRRRISVSHATLGSESRLIDVAGGDHGAMSFALVEATPAAAPPAAEPPVAATAPPLPAETPAPFADAGGPRSSIPWAGWMATAVLAAGAGVTGALALQRSQELGNERARFGAERSELDRLEKEATTFAVAADICAGSAAFAGILSLYLTLSSGANQSEQGRAVHVAPGLGFVSVEGSF